MKTANNEAKSLPAAKIKLQKAWDLLEQARLPIEKRDFEDAVAGAFQGMPVETKEDAIILCSAIAGIMFGIESPDEIHPHSQFGIDLQAAMSMFAYLAIEQAVGKDEDFKQPEWID